MPRKANPVQVGRMDCVGCGSRIPVYINARGYFYTKCMECGTDQRNGKTVQTHIYLNTDWTGDPPAPPRNVDPDAAHRVPEPETPAPEPETVPETDPAPVPAVPENNRKKPTFKPFAFGVLFPLLIIGVLPK